MPPGHPGEPAREHRGRHTGGDAGGSDGLRDAGHLVVEQPARSPRASQSLGLIPVPARREEQVGSRRERRVEGLGDLGVGDHRRVRHVGAPGAQGLDDERAPLVGVDALRRRASTP